MIEKFNSAIDTGLTKNIFDHLRNLLICTLLLAIGTTELREQSSEVFTFFSSKYSGTGVIGISLLLILLNFYDGIRKIYKAKYHIIFTIVLSIIYLFISVRVIEMAWHFRMPY